MDFQNLINRFLHHQKQNPIVDIWPAPAQPMQPLPELPMMPQMAPMPQMATRQQGGLPVRPTLGQLPNLPEIKPMPLHMIDYPRQYNTGGLKVSNKIDNRQIGF